MEELVARHRKEQRDLQSQITQKKKSASKKTRKGVNEECERLELELKNRQADELSAFKGDAGPNGLSNQEAAVTDASAAPALVDDLLDSIVSPTRDDVKDGVQNMQINDDYHTEKAENQSGQRKPNRQKARLARRAAEQDAARDEAAKEAANMPDLKTRERNKMLEESKKRGLVEKEVAANGHCLYLAVADQITQLKLSIDPLLSSVESPNDADTAQAKLSDFKKVRAVAAHYIADHRDDFEPFLEEPFENYVKKIRDTGEWGGQLELAALAKAYRLNFSILQADGRLEKIDAGRDDPSGEAWLAYYRHGFGLGEHYNSLRKSPSTG